MARRNECVEQPARATHKRGKSFDTPAAIARGWQQANTPSIEPTRRRQRAPAPPNVFHSFTESAQRRRPVSRAPRFSSLNRQMLQVGTVRGRTNLDIQHDAAAGLDALRGCGGDV